MSLQKQGGGEKIREQKKGKILFLQMLFQAASPPTQLPDQRWHFGTQKLGASETGLPLATAPSHSPQNSVNLLKISLVSTCQAVREISKVLGQCIPGL